MIRSNDKASPTLRLDEKTNVEEYSISEGWIRVAAGRSRDRHGNPMTLKLKAVTRRWCHTIALACAPGS